MTNPNYKKYIGYIGAGVFGVLLVIGLRGASAASPSDLPSSNVTPTFSGLNVKRNGSDISTGNVKIDGFLDVKDNIDAETVNVDQLVAGPTSITGDLNVYNGKSTFYGTSSFEGDIWIDNDSVIRNSYGSINDDYVYIDDGLKVSKNIDAQGGISNSVANYSSVYSFMTVLKSGVCELNVKQDSTIIKTINVVDNKDDGKENVSITVDGNDLFTTISFPACTADPVQQTVTTGGLKIKDNVIVTGDLNAKSMQISGKAALLGDTEIKNAYITGSLQHSAGADDYIKVDDMLDVRKGIFNNDDTKLIKFGSGSSPMDLSVTGKSTVKTLDISTSGKISYGGTDIISFTKGSLANGVEITGNLKAKNIGAYSSSTVTKSLPTLKTDSVVTYCGSSNEKLLSCTFWTPGYLTISSLERIKKTSTDKTETWGCSLTAYNSTSIAYNMSVTAFCYNSNSF